MIASSKDQDVAALIKLLSSRSPSVRTTAQAALAKLTPDQIDSLVQIIRAEPKRTIRRIGLWFAVVACPTVLLPAWFAFGTRGLFSSGLLYLLFAALLLIYMSLFPLLVALPIRAASLLYCTTHVSDVKMLGPLVTCAGNTPRVRSAVSNLVSRVFGGGQISVQSAENALLAVLAKIVPGEELELTSAERTAIPRLLFITRNTAEAAAILSLLEEIGVASDILAVRRIEIGGAFSPSSPDLKAAAAHCRATIEARIAEQKIPATLLRASQSSAPDTELVRATLIPTPVEEQLLLRSGKSGE